ncbi:unnamed protein product [Orchesella dallaii]|uniref:Fibrous sheath-interacting protein 2 n=1 Tax=Orchesella dallaii TaxID=48710 RepID=A0ABP1R0E6_9HEXA
MFLIFYNMSDIDVENRSDNGPEEDDTAVVNIDADEGEEGEEQDTFPFDYFTFVAKLKEKPKFPAESKDCGALAPKKSYKDWTCPVQDRLSLHTLTAIDLIKEKLPFPQGSVPPLALPSWYLMPLEKKIPIVQSPKGLFYFSRGKLCEKLHRDPVIYSVKDPNNLERVVGAPYTSLHDPHTKSILYNPLTRNLLLDRGFINDADEVLCSLKEFNKFRDYLRTLYCDQIWKQIENDDLFWKYEREQLRNLLKAENQSVGREAIMAGRIATAKKFQADAADFRKKKHAHREQITESRLRQWRGEKERKLLEQIMSSIELARRTRERLQALYDLRLQQRRDIVTKSVRKLIDTVERQTNDKAMMQAAYNKFLLEWIQSKYVFCYNKLIEKRQLQEDLSASIKYKGKKRQQRLEYYRERLPDLVEKRKAEAERILGIVRKFAMRWLERVRRRLHAPKDVKHESCWIGQSKGVLDDTVKYLRAESGYEKLDDFILNIMKLKKQIQAQIELEEAEEAAALAAAEEGEGEEEGGDAAAPESEPAEET